MKKQILPQEDSEFQSQFLEPPDFFGLVTQKIFRCGAISPTHFSFLDLYQFKTVLFLGEDTPHQRIVEYLNNRKITFQRIPTYSQNSKIAWRTQLDELVKITLQYILNDDNLPVLISSPSELLVCTVIGCLRRMQRWNISSILDEFRRFSPEVPQTQNTNYVELFDFDLVEIPEHSFLRET